MEGRLYVANAGDNSISVVSAGTLRETDRIPLYGGAEGPRALALRAGWLYHADSYSATVGRIHLGDGRQELLCAGACPTELCVWGGSLYVACGESNSVWRLNRANWTLELCRPVGIFPVGIRAHGGRIWIAELLGGMLRCLEADSMEEIRRMDTDGMPLALDCQGGACYTAVLLPDGHGKIVAFSSHGGVLWQIAQEFPSGYLQCLRRQKKAVAAHVWDDSFSLIDCEERRVIWTKPCARMPDRILVDEKSGRMYLSCMQSDVVQAFDLEGELLAEIPVGREPRGLALYSPSGFARIESRER